MPPGRLLIFLKQTRPGLLSGASSHNPLAPGGQTRFKGGAFRPPVSNRLNNFSFYGLNMKTKRLSGPGAQGLYLKARGADFQARFGAREDLPPGRSLATGPHILKSALSAIVGRAAFRPSASAARV